jgi:hypothetical protein
MVDIGTNPEGVVEQYCGVIARLESAVDEPGKAEWRGVARRMRQAWREWQGEDSQHEMAFGETIVNGAGK